MLLLAVAMAVVAMVPTASKAIRAVPRPKDWRRDPEPEVVVPVLPVDPTTP